MQVTAPPDVATNLGPVEFPADALIRSLHQARSARRPGQAALFELLLARRSPAILTILTRSQHHADRHARSAQAESKDADGKRLRHRHAAQSHSQHCSDGSRATAPPAFRRARAARLLQRQLRLRWPPTKRRPSPSKPLQRTSTAKTRWSSSTDGMSPSLRHRSPASPLRRISKRSPTTRPQPVCPSRPPVSADTAPKPSSETPLTAYKKGPHPLRMRASCYSILVYPQIWVPHPSSARVGEQEPNWLSYYPRIWAPSLNRFAIQGWVTTRLYIPGSSGPCALALIRMRLCFL